MNLMLRLGVRDAKNEVCSVTYDSTSPSRRWDEAQVTVAFIFPPRCFCSAFSQTVHWLTSLKEAVCGCVGAYEAFIEWWVIELVLYLDDDHWQYVCDGYQNWSLKLDKRWTSCMLIMVPWGWGSMARALCHRIAYLQTETAEWRIDDWPRVWEGEKIAVRVAAFDSISALLSAWIDIERTLHYSRTM